MGFDQYHEPAGELSAETRTFARMIASLTEEAEAIGWYEQRHRRSSRTLRRRRSWRTRRRRSSSTSAWISSSCCGARRSGAIALKAILFTDGDIVEQGEKAEELENS